MGYEKFYDKTFSIYHYKTLFTNSGNGLFYVKFSPWISRSSEVGILHVFIKYIKIQNLRYY